MWGIQRHHRFQLSPVKIVTTGEGGAALTNDSFLADRLQRLRSHGIAREAFEFESPGPWYYEQQELGFNYRLTDLQAALGLSQLERLEAFVDRRRALVDRYRTAVGLAGGFAGGTFRLPQCLSPGGVALPWGV